MGEIEHRWVRCRKKVKPEIYWWRFSDLPQWSLKNLKKKKKFEKKNGKSNFKNKKRKNKFRKRGRNSQKGKNKSAKEGEVGGFCDGFAFLCSQIDLKLMISSDWSYLHIYIIGKAQVRNQLSPFSKKIIALFKYHKLSCKK